MAPTIPIFGLEWHIRHSPSQRFLVHDPLRPYIQFETIPWDGEKLPALPAHPGKSNPLVFYHLPPPPAVMNDPSRRVVWIPMWDEARGYDLAWWQRLPKKLRVISFSEEVAIRSKTAGLDTLELKYYASPDEYRETEWTSGRVFFYWNRSGLVGKDFLSKFCRSLDIDLMIYRRDAHSRIPAGMDFPLPDRLGSARVQAVPLSQWPPRNEYTELLGRANIFLAPRTSEGVGLAFLEAMAQGCAVFAYDAATMNEYITHGENGFLFRKYGRSAWNDARGRAGGRMENLRKRFGFSPRRLPYPVSGMQDWSEIRKLDLKKLGDNARQSQRLGFQEWMKAIPKYAGFILDW